MNFPVLLRFIKVNEKHRLRLSFEPSDVYGQEDAAPTKQLTEAAHQETTARGAATAPFIPRSTLRP